MCLKMLFSVRQRCFFVDSAFMAISSVSEIKSIYNAESSDKFLKFGEFKSDV